MGFIETIKEKAKANQKTIVLPETNDIRTLEAAHKVLKEKIANLILLGDEATLKAEAAKANLNLDAATFINPASCDELENYVELFVKLRGHKGLSEKSARALLLENPLYFGVALVKSQKADGMVAGAINSTADVLRASLQILGTKKDSKLVSAFFLMVVPNCDYGEKGIFIFADSGLVQNPNAQELASIAIDSAKSFQSLVGKEPIVAMLSHSTKGSAKHPDVDKVIEATKLAQSLAPQIAIDGEFQLDAAIVPSVGKSKAPESKIAGYANVLVFPDLDSGNIGYKLTQRLAKAEAYGPITQGIAAPVNDLSRGCSSDDIVGVVAITALQAQQN
ncbi:MAG: phosphate acetyltransferase [Helicobacter sp.]|uniref:phosphate acetyltransferase n=1 Tax=Helicobacter TaxID=209 RepID=UPI001F5ADFB0|nr:MULTISPECIES: phosphate acetyltransferase [Helicobacter]MCI2235967.1 phosphate acetyltransferase [Helicobacter sp. CaF467b]MCL9820173.1 phosphate acetyltransferase [Helicobacter colisuis]MCL9822197.1 phosphate acetyltransferase [Helicobacter colisuis]MDY4426768.1 phosphate acetyltransferase [Helicobacter sp.]MDY5616568.1 phosphate acetyltransferase [Helicobacter sp.]